jgi:hypothetical protein
MPPLNRLRTVATFALLSCVLVACSQSGSSGQPQTLKSPDSKFQFTVPGGWESRSDLAPGEIFKARNGLGDIDVVVRSKNKAEFPEGLTLESYAESARNGLLSRGFNEITEPVSLTVNGNDARQMEFKKDDTMVRCVMTLVYSPEHINTISACAPISKYEENKATLKQVSESLRGV